MLLVLVFKHHCSLFKVKDCLLVVTSFNCGVALSILSKGMCLKKMSPGLAFGPASMLIIITVTIL